MRSFLRSLRRTPADVPLVWGPEGEGRVPPPASGTVLALAPHPDDAESAAVTLKLLQPMSWTEVHFARRFRSGYAWLFPKGEVANVGLGCVPSGGRAEMLPLLDSFVSDLRRAGGLADGPPVRRTAGWIPVWGPPETAVAGAVLLAGDAAGFTDPLTGAGIWPAIATGELAGKWAARAALEGDVSLLSGYDEDWRGLMGAALARSAAARRKMESEWDSRELAELVRDVWPGLRP